MDTARMLTKCSKPISRKQVEDFIIGLFQGTLELESHPIIFGFIYEEGKGIYTIGPAEELNKVKHPDVVIEPFDFENYIKTTNHRVFWTIDYLNENGPTLVAQEKSPR